jgi:hypothetical protein
MMAAMLRRFTLGTIVCALLGACGDDQPTPGLRGECAQTGGTLLGCDDGVIETAEDACWKLVECGVIPVDHTDDGVLDWSRRVTEIRVTQNERERFILACVEASSCDDLKDGRSPINPPRWEDALPLCLQYGDR